MALPPLDLDALFPSDAMFESRSAWSAAGFAVIPRDEETRIMVAGHILAPCCIFKKYANPVPWKKQIEKYRIRVDGAHALASFISERSLRGVVVPDKRIVDLGNSRGHLVVAERLNVMNRAQSEAAYCLISEQALHALVTVLYTFRGLDSGLRNVPLTRFGQAAFIDTERWDDKSKGPYLESLQRYLTRGQRAFVKQTLKELREQADG